MLNFNKIKIHLMIGKIMKLYIDESGSITEDNSNKNKFFVISCLEIKNDYRAIRQFRNSKKKIIDKYKNLDLRQEIKGSQMPYEMKEKIFNDFRSKTDAKFHFIIADNHKLKSSLRRQSSLTFNYLISLLIRSIIKENKISHENTLYLLIDERNQSVESTNSLEEYLKIEFTIKNNIFDNVIVKYKDSKTKDLVQAADVFANTLYRASVNLDDVKNRKLIKLCNVGVCEFFPIKHNILDFCNKIYYKVDKN